MTHDELAAALRRSARRDRPPAGAAERARAAIAPRRAVPMHAIGRLAWSIGAAGAFAIAIVVALEARPSSPTRFVGAGGGAAADAALADRDAPSTMPTSPHEAGAGRL